MVHQNMVGAGTVVMAVLLVVAVMSMNVQPVILPGESSPVLNVYPAVVIEGITESRTGIYDPAELGIPASISHVDTMIVDIPEINGKLARGEQVSVEINGTRYQMELRELDNGDRGAVRSYTGHLVGVEQSEVVLTVSDRILLARISIDETDYIIDSTIVLDSVQPDRILHCTYCSGDVLMQGETAHCGLKSPGSADIEVSTLAQSLFPGGEAAPGEMVNVTILVTTDSAWNSTEPDWETKARHMVAEANNQLGHEDIGVHLIPIFDSTRQDELSSDSNVSLDPLQVFYRQLPPSYLDSRGADIALYLGGYDASLPAVAAAWGFDTGPPMSRYAWAQMVDDDSSFAPIQHDRTVWVLHEIGHLFDADHQDAAWQTEKYNRAYEWSEFALFPRQTVLWDPSMNSTRYAYSSAHGFGNENHDNAKRMRETRNIVADYYRDGLEQA